MMIVIIPAWHRPEFLHICCENIIKATGADRNYYVFLLDEGAVSDNLDIYRQFPFDKHVRQLKSRIGHGNSYNILSGYRLGYMLAKERNFKYLSLIEEDCFVARDYFMFHRACHEFLPEVFCVSACRNQNIQQMLPTMPNAVYKHCSYQSLGVSFKIKDMLRIIVHDNDVYYRHPQLYMQSLFRKLAMPAIFSEQDALIHNVMVNESLFCAYPLAPRAFHAGYYGYGGRKGKAPTGTLEQKIAQLKAMTADDMNQATDWKDITHCNLGGYGAIDEFKEYKL